MSTLTRLEELTLYQERLADVTPLAGMRQLKVLRVGNGLSDLTPLENSIELEEVWLNNNQISNLSPLCGMTKLRFLQLWDNHVTDLAPLAGLKGLRYLHLGQNNITDVTPLAGLAELEQLRLYGNNITDVTPLAGLTSLRVAELHRNPGIEEADIVNLRKALPDCEILGWDGASGSPADFRPTGSR
ncbi:MAG: leucine-rich repeat domain-containing protein [Pirellulales bacterium]